MTIDSVRNRRGGDENTAGRASEDKIIVKQPHGKEQLESLEAGGAMENFPPQLS
jgi:hypothetical protein